MALKTKTTTQLMNCCACT